MSSVARSTLAWTTVLGLAMSALLAVAAPPAQAAATGSVIVGKVRAEGGPVAAARVLAYHWQQVTQRWRRVATVATTDANGKYKLKGLQAGRYHLLVLPAQERYAPVWYGADVEWDHPPGLVFDPGTVPADAIRGTEITVASGQKSKGHSVTLTPVGRLDPRSTALDVHGDHPVIDLRYHHRNDENATGAPVTSTWQRHGQLSLGLLEVGTHTFWSRTSATIGDEGEEWLPTVVTVPPSQVRIDLPGQAVLHARSLTFDYEHIPGTALPGTVARAVPAHLLRWTYPAKGMSFGMQWYRDGAPIPGATSDTYVIAAADVGRMLQVEATASRPGYGIGTVRSSAVLVRETPRTHVELTLGRDKVRYGQTDDVVVDVSVTLSDGAQPQGYGVVIHQGCAEENPAQDACFGWSAYAERQGPTTWRLRLPARIPIQDRIYAEFLPHPHYQWAQASRSLTIKPQPSTVRLRPKKATISRGAGSETVVRIAAPHNRRTDIRGTVVVKAGGRTVGRTVLGPMGGAKGQRVAVRKVAIGLRPLPRTGTVTLRAIFKPEKVTRSLPSNDAKVLRGDSGAKRGTSQKVTVRVR